MVSNGIMESHAETIAMVMVPGSAELSELAASVAASLVSVPAAAGAAVVAVCDAELPQPASADATNNTDTAFFKRLLFFMFFLLFVRCPLREGIKLYSVKSSSWYQEHHGCRHQ